MWRCVTLLVVIRLWIEDGPDPFTQFLGLHGYLLSAAGSVVHPGHDDPQPPEHPLFPTPARS